MRVDQQSSGHSRTGVEALAKLILSESALITELRVIRVPAKIFVTAAKTATVDSDGTETPPGCSNDVYFP